MHTAVETADRNEMDQPITKTQIFQNAPGVLPMSISSFGTKEEVQLKVSKQGLDKIGVGIDRCSSAICYIPSSSTFRFNAFLSRNTHHTKLCRIGRNWY